ncbi:adenosine kinase [Bacteroidota bacterium]
MINKTIELCGIGNGLVDIQVEINDAVISEFKLNKGGMQLAEIDRQKALIEKLEGKRLESKEQHKSSGGSAANTIIAFAQFGGKAAYNTVLGKDKLGKFYADEFTSLGIELIPNLDEASPTGTCLVLITPDTERTMVTALGASANFNKEQVLEELIAKSQWLYIEGYEFTQEASTEAIFKSIELAKKHNTKIALTFSDVFITELFYDNLKKAAVESDLIFCNEAEAKSFTKTETLDKALRVFDKYYKNFVITKGSEGSYVKWNNLRLEIPPYHAEPKDSTGAGDMYAGGFMYGIISTGSPLKAGHLASAAAAKVVSQLGARLKENHKELRDSIFEKIK